MDVVLKDFSQTLNTEEFLVEDEVHACLLEKESGRLIVSARLEYIAEIIRCREYRLVEVVGQNVVPSRP